MRYCLQYKNNILQKACQTAGGMFIMCLHTSPAWVAGKALFPPEAFRITAGLSPPRRGGQEGNGRFVPLFGFANGLLAFLALAAVLDFLPVLRHRRAPAVWWGEERLLFTTRYARCAKNTVHGRFCWA